MAENQIALPNIVSRQAWLVARQELLKKEKALTQTRDALHAERRRLPMVQIEKAYVFEGPSGPARLLDLGRTPPLGGRRRRRMDGGATTTGTATFRMRTPGAMRPKKVTVGRMHIDCRPGVRSFVITITHEG